MPYINVTMASGRTLEAKQAMMAAIAEAVSSSIGCDRSAVRVWVTEVAPEQMSVGGTPLDQVLAERAAAATG